MEFLPLFLNGQQRRAVVIGGGKVALRKVRLLRRSGMHVKVIAVDIISKLKSLSAEDSELECIERTYQGGDVIGAFLVIAATNDKALNEQICMDCKQKNIMVNSVDNIDHSDFILPSSFVRKPIQIAVSTAGASPLLARSLIKHLENCTPKAYGQLAGLIQQYRAQVKQTFSHSDQRKVFWEHVLQSRVADLVFANRYQEAEKLLSDILRDKVDENGHFSGLAGEVYLVGAGPGDPDLLTFKALRLMQQADIVIHDRLVSKSILDLIKEGTEKIYAGKERSKHTIPQDKINELLVHHAKQGKRVLRLKGGDPFIFGRGGEEIESLMKENISFQIVPGITAASGCSAYAGIPLTHRDHAHSCIFVAGHLKEGSVRLNWDALIQEKQTIVFYMGLQTLGEICLQLQAHGLASDTPIALIAQGTTEKQRVIVGKLETFTEQVKQEDVKPPTLLIVGNVVRLRDELKWFDPVQS